MKLILHVIRILGILGLAFSLYRLQFTDFGQLYYETMEKYLVVLPKKPKFFILLTKIVMLVGLVLFIAMEVLLITDPKRFGL